ncbi:MAG: hypothetical protein KDI68_11715 [Gammaproteobacteria bacterium]|nr:hypothetical protein [Gammaproteobacteria bacterium]
MTDAITSWLTFRSGPPPAARLFQFYIELHGGWRRFSSGVGGESGLRDIHAIVKTARRSGYVIAGWCFSQFRHGKFQANMDY